MMRMIRKFVLAALLSPLAESTIISVQEERTTNKSNQFHAQDLQAQRYS
jgi:hypothetical protein